MKIKKAKIISLAAALLLITLAGLGFYGCSRIAKTKIKKVLIISMDTTRADFLSCYGYEKNTTPNIDALAAEAVLFENTISPAPMTLPAHSTLLTGTTPPYHGAHDNTNYILAETNVTLPEILKKNHFTTAGIISAIVIDRNSGLGQGFDTYDDTFDQTYSSIGMDERRGVETTAHAIEWLDHHADENFFLFLHYYDPHVEYEPPEPFKSRFPNNPYAGEIAYTDHYIGKVIDKLKKLGIYDSTLIIIVGDHGEMKGEHGEITHGYYIYQSVIQVPMIFKLPFTTESKRIKEIVGLVDVVPTICSLLDIKMPPNIHGKDLSGYFGKSEPKKDDRYIYCQSLAPTQYKAASLLGIVNNRYKYIQTTRPELYDLIEDDGELKNLMNEKPQIAKIMKDKLKQILEQQTLKGENQGKVLADDSRIARLQALGYVGTGELDESFEFDQTKTDPKDLIEFHRINTLTFTYVAQKKLNEAKKLCEIMIGMMPDFPMIYRYLADIAKEEGDCKSIVKNLKKYVELDPDDHMILNNLGLGYFCLNKLEQAENVFRKSLDIKPDYVEANYNLARILVRRGAVNQAIEHFNFVRQARPGFEDIEEEMELVTRRRDARDNAIMKLNDILDENPDDIKVHHKLATIYGRQRQSELVAQHYKEIVRLEPGNHKIRFDLASTLLELGQDEDAVNHLRHILKTKPDNAGTINALAWVLATSKDVNTRNPKEAIELALRGCQLTNFKMPELLDTLAASYAADGQFEQAIKNAEKAVQKAKEEDKNQLVDEVHSRIKLYKAGKPYIEFH
ncbi:MAG: sulfatase-like hydrolase/transferase [Planctomycetes bacterium]|nr:sulfatase-like hydrolase/transferase [Planctomycetota bacterium]